MSFPRGDLPPLSFAEKSVTQTQADIITAYEAIAGITLSVGDPRRVFLEALASIIAQQRTIIDFSAKQNFLTYSQGDYLDHIGDFKGNITRLEAQPALTTIRFTLSAAQASVYLIPAGTQLVAGQLNFATTENLEIAIGELTGDVTAQCTTAGTVGNGLLPGQIKTLLVQNLPFIESAINITASSGGAEVEDDEAYVERMRLSAASYSVAGPKPAYVFWARSANPAIIDVSVPDPSSAPGVVNVLPLLENGVLPSQEVLDQVLAVLDDEEIRPFGDDVVVSAPTAVNYQIEVQYWIGSDKAGQASTIQTAVNSAIEDYRVWQRTSIGRDINPDEIIARVKNAGAKRVNVVSPVFTVVTDWQVAQESSVAINYQGVENV